MAASGSVPVAAGRRRGTARSATKSTNIVTCTKKSFCRWRTKKPSIPAPSPGKRPLRSKNKETEPKVRSFLAVTKVRVAGCRWRNLFPGNCHAAVKIASQLQSYLWAGLSHLPLREGRVKNEMPGNPPPLAPAIDIKRHVKEGSRAGVRPPGGFGGAAVCRGLL